MQHPEVRWSRCSSLVGRGRWCRGGAVRSGRMATENAMAGFVIHRCASMGNRAIAETVMPAAPATMPSRARNDAASSSAPTKFHPTTGATGSALTQGAGPPHRGVRPPAPIPMPLARYPISCRRGVRKVWAAAAPGRHLPMTMCRTWVGGPSATRPPPTSRPSSRDRYSNTRCSGRREPAWQPR